MNYRLRRKHKRELIIIFCFASMTVLIARYLNTIQLMNISSDHIASPGIV